MNKQKGITLVALVITIIVLLILAGVTLYTLFSEDGVITKARQSVKVNEWGITKEQLLLKVNEYVLTKNSNKDNKKTYIEYLLEDGYINDDAVVQMEKIAENSLKYGRGNLQKGDVYYFESERLYYIEKSGEKVDLGAFNRIGQLPSFLYWNVSTNNDNIIDLDKGTTVTLTISNYNGDKVTKSNLVSSVKLTENSSDLVSVMVDDIELTKENTSELPIIKGREKVDQAHTISVVSKGSEITTDQPIRLEIKGKTDGAVPREEIQYIDINVKPKALYWNSNISANTVELNVDNASLNLITENHKDENITYNRIDFEVSLENKDTNLFAVTVDGVDLTQTNYTGSIEGREKNQAQNTITIRKQDGKPITTNEQVTLKIKVKSPLVDEKIIKIDVKQHWLIDYSGNGYHAQLKNGAEIIKKDDGYAVTFDGIDDFVEIPTLSGTFDWTSAINIDAHVNFRETPKDATILSLSNPSKPGGSWSNDVIFSLYGAKPRLYFLIRGTYNWDICENWSNTDFALNTKNHLSVLMEKEPTIYKSAIWLNGSKVSDWGNTSSSVGTRIEKKDRYNNYIGKTINGQYLKGEVYLLKLSTNRGETIFNYDLSR